MGEDKYFTFYTAATHDQSTAGSIAAYESYAHCRRHVNDALTRTLPAARQAQVAQVRRDLETLAGACFDYTYLSAGGGTLWGQMQAADHGQREDFLATLIGDLHHSDLHHSDLRRPAPRTPAGHRLAQAARHAARHSLAGLRTPKAEGASTLSAAYSTDYRVKTYPAALAAFARLQTLIASLPDPAARRLARELQHELAAPAKNVP